MKWKGDAHEKPSLFFKRDGVAPNMVIDGSKENTLGSFMKKCQEADFHIKQTELYSPWQIQAEGTTGELKKGAVRKMVWEGALKRVWDNEMEFEAYVISNTALDIYMLQGEVPETVMLGGTSDIS